MRVRGGLRNWDCPPPPAFPEGHEVIPLGKKPFGSALAGSGGSIADGTIDEQTTTAKGGGFFETQHRFWLMVHGFGSWLRVMVCGKAVRTLPLP